MLSDLQLHSKDISHLQSIPELREILIHIKSCHKIMIIMRGAPGSGKSYLARSIVDHWVYGDFNSHVFSTDDFFYSNCNNYVYCPRKLGEAHIWNQNIVKKKAIEGWSPIIVDNTNIRIWEFLPYTEIAVKCGYIIKFLEPTTWWCKSASELHLKNKHGVSKEKIKIMLNNFEPISEKQFLQHSVTLPQIQKFPKKPRRKSEGHGSNNTINSSFGVFCIKNGIVVASQFQKTEYNKDCPNQEEDMEKALNASIKFKNPSELVNSLLRGHNTLKKEEVLATNNIQKINLLKLEKHAPDCKNENMSFRFVRQIFPSRNIIELWKIFESYNGDLNKVIGILFKNDSRSPLLNSKLDTLSCLCSQQNLKITANKCENASLKLMLCKDHKNVRNINNPGNINNCSSRTIDMSEKFGLKLQTELLEQLQSSLIYDLNTHKLLSDLNTIYKELLEKLYSLSVKACNKEVKYQSRNISEGVAYDDYYYKKIDLSKLYYKLFQQHKLNGLIPIFDKNILLSIFKIISQELKDTLEGSNVVIKKICKNDNSPAKRKREALLDFEESRNLAAHHSQLKSECFERAKEAIQGNVTSTALYYYQIASFHKSKTDFYNHKAANCIIEVNELSQHNQNFIDLHYLHTLEALQCLDIYLDEHIIKLCNQNKCYIYIYVITGRGLHSAGGISAIKNNVKNRLKNRNLKWTEVNPGLLKVKLYATSLFSKTA